MSNTIKKKTSPMMEHYRRVKAMHQDCVVFYRLGDFYEMFDDDAIRVSEMLDLTLTGRDCGEEKRAPMCGIPFHAADQYIAKLVSMGEKVAICEQLGNSENSKLFERDVIKIVTSGTLTNNELIEATKNNFLASVYVNKKEAALSWADITTGEFFVKKIDGDDYAQKLVDELVKISPAEIIANKEAEEKFRELPLIKYGVLPKFSYFLESEFSFSNAENTLKKQFGVMSLSAYPFESDNSVSCAGALVSYLKQTQKNSIDVIRDVKIVKNNDFMSLDVNAVRNLELVKTLRDGKRYGSLLWLLDKTKTSMGARKLQSWILSPLCDKQKIEYRQNGVKAFYDNNLIRQGLSDIFSSVRDVGRIGGRISNGILNPKDCIALKDSLENIPSIKFQLCGINSPFVKKIDENLKDFSDIVSLIGSAINPDASSVMKDGNYIKSGFNSELDELRSYKKNGQALVAKLERDERERTGIKNLKISHNRVFGYYIEVTNSFKEMVPYEYIRRQTLANAERYVTEELKDLEAKIFGSAEKALALEAKIFESIRNVLTERIEDLIVAADALSDLDVIIALATVARENNYVLPQIKDFGEKLSIVDGRHPVVEKISKQRFVPNDALLDNRDNRTMVITGPNMAGKSTFMRQIALITLMTHIGSYVPCAHAEIPLTDKIFTRIGASDNLISDQSTFMVEMTEVANIIKCATENSLILLDEIGRGTSTFDGLSIAWAVLEYFTQKIHAKTLFATHYHELTELEGNLDGVKNYKVAVKEVPNGIIFVRKIVRGGTNKSFGIEVAELAGVEKALTQRAREILKKLENKEINLDFASKNDDDTKEKTINKESEIERIILDLDVNNLSPLKAFNLLTDLYEKAKEKYGEN